MAYRPEQPVEKQLVGPIELGILSLALTKFGYHASVVSRSNGCWHTSDYRKIEYDQKKLRIFKGGPTIAEVMAQYEVAKEQMQQRQKRLKEAIDEFNGDGTGVQAKMVPIVTFEDIVSKLTR